MLRRASHPTLATAAAAGRSLAYTSPRCSIRHGTESRFFKTIPLAPPDVILGLSREFAEDPDQKKVNLAVGVYRDAAGQPYVLDCVKRASAQLPMTNMDYAPITGAPAFIESAQRICFGQELAASVHDRLLAVQSLSGTGALRLAADFLKRFGTNVIHVPSPTYPNHAGIFRDAGLEMCSYPYYSTEAHALQLEQMVDYLEKLPARSVVLLHACAHNPTGFDPSREQWQVITATMAEKRLIPFVDMAYQGFASGDLRHDGRLLEVLLKGNFPDFLVAQSFAKNFGLYGQRTGAIHICCEDCRDKGPILSQLSALARATYSSPPIYGAQLVDTIVRDPELYVLWQTELSTMARRMLTIRQKLYDALIVRGVTRPITQIRDGHGMMALSGLNPEEVKELRDKYHVFMVGNGRIAFSGLTEGNLDYVADAMSAIMNRKK